VILTLRNVCLNKHLLCWPFLQIKLFDGTNLLMQVTQPLFIYARATSEITDLVTDKDLKIAAAQLMNSPSLSLTQQ
jgi:hypothetical protein